MRDPDADDGTAAPQLLTFDLGERRYGCRLDAVREVLVARPAARLPGAPSYVLGLLNLRGTLLTVLDVGAALAAEESHVPAADSAAGHVLVVECDGHLAGCRVDHVRHVHAWPALDALPGPAADARPVGNAERGAIVLGIGEVDGESVAVLDLLALVRQTLLFPGER